MSDTVPSDLPPVVTPLTTPDAASAGSGSCDPGLATPRVEPTGLTPAVDVRLSVVAPCRDEADNLADFVAELVAALSDPAAAPGVKPFEVIIVDDGSRDASREIALGLRSQYPGMVRVVALDGPHGKTSALAAGFAAARGAVVATIDADLQDDPADIPRLVAYLDEAGVDAVNGSRRQRQDNRLRRFSSRLANAIRNWLSGETIADSASGLKVYRAACLARLKLYHGLHRFMPTLVKIEGYRVAEQPINNRPRIRGQAKYGFWNRVFAAFWDLLAVRWMKARQLRHTARELP